MNKLTKVGLSALAGSLAVSSANAVEYSLTGDAQAVFSSAEGNEANAVGSNGKGYGVDTDLYVNASGELDNGWTVSIFSALNLEQANTATSGGVNSSSQMTIGMGSLGTIQFNDVFGSGATSIDDVLPKAYEETWDGTSHASAFHSFGVSTQSGSVDYRTPAFSIGDISISATYTYDPDAGNYGYVSAGGVTPGQNEGEAYTIKVSGMGLTLGAGTEEVENASNSAGATDLQRATGYALYTNGPMTIGYQEYYVNSANAATNGAEAPDNSGDGMAILFAQDNYSVSYAEVNEQVEKIGGATTQEYETEMTALQATYTMGAMTIGASLYETDNPEGTTGKYEETELSVSFAF
jgi:hypothetical protein